MKRFARRALWSSNLPLQRPCLNRWSPPLERTPKQHPCPLPLWMPHRRMAPNAPAASFKRPSPTGLRHARCLFHPLREAAALCPHCAGTFCRECVTDEEGKLACPPCLRRMARPPAPKLSQARRFRQVLVGLAALASLVGLFFVLLRWRMNTPEQHLNFGRIVDDRLPEPNHE